MPHISFLTSWYHLPFSYYLKIPIHYTKPQSDWKKGRKKILVKTVFNTSKHWGVYMVYKV